MNRKGFTLIELLMVIVVIGLVLGISIYGMTNVFSESKKHKIKIDEKGILVSAKIYSSEVDSTNWIGNGNSKYFCVTIEELRNKGLIDKKVELPENLSLYDYVIFKKDNVTLVSDNGKIDKNNECDGSRGNVSQYPKLTLPNLNYTDELGEITFTNGKMENDSNITKTICYYGSYSSKMIGEIEAKDGKCILGPSLKNSSTYYVRVCQEFDNGDRACSSTESTGTASFIKPTFNTEKNLLTITYNDTGIKGKDKNYGHYFTSTLPGISKEGVEECTLNNNVFTCSGSTTSIEKNKWYRTTKNIIPIEYNTPGKGTVTARIVDKSNNYAESEKNIELYKITFNGNGGEVTPSSIVVFNGGNYGDLATATRSGYTLTGWNTKADGSGTTINKDSKVNLTVDQVLYAQWTANKVIIKYSINGGTITETTTDANGGVYKWKADSNGIISKTAINGSTYSELTQTFKYGESGKDLANYNNSKYLNITKTGYSAVSGEEWKCLSGCTTSGKTFSQVTNYESTDFCDTSKGDCAVTIGVNWVKNVTYSCPSGYTCTGGSCTASSQCAKTITGDITEMYYCPHDGSYQTNSTCSYTGWEKAAMNLTCAKDGTTTCTESTYSCAKGTLVGKQCWMYNRYSCISGWTSSRTGYCEFSCGNIWKVNGRFNMEGCTGTSVCSSGGSGYTCGICAARSCYSKSCSTTNTLYNCHTAATEVTHCSANKTYAGGSYAGCRVVGSDSVTNGFKCSSGGTNQYNDVGTDSCGVSGYTLTRTLDGGCDSSLKYDKEGKLYCNTSDYWKGKSCTDNYAMGASAIYKLTCSKTGTKKYYCDANQTYYSSKPSSCTTTEYEDIIAS